MPKIDRNLFTDFRGKVQRNSWRVEQAAQRTPASAVMLAHGVHLLYGFPSWGLQVIGVTGTNGKTTTAYLIHQTLNSLGCPAGLLSTVDVDTGLRQEKAWLTTPNAIDLARLLREMVKAGCGACAMEVSSHALQEHRTRAIRFSVALFTNLSHDHLDYHDSITAYAAAKARLFSGLGPDAAAVLNRDDPFWNVMIRDSRADVLTFGAGEGDSLKGRGRGHISYWIEENQPAGLRLKVDGESRRFRLCGEFNAKNLVAAYSAVRAMGYGKVECLDALEGARGAPGRLEVIRPPEGVPGPIGIVDYAHNPGGLETVLTTVRQFLPKGGRLILVFGCGGDRDRSKRPVMGELASKLADEVVITNDNPRCENPDQIITEILEGMSRPPRAVVPDRAAAVAWACEAARPGDVVLVAGKGHERFQLVGNTSLPFDDREIITRHLAARLGSLART